MEKYKIYWWNTRNFDAIPNGVVYVEDVGIDVYEVYYQLVQEKEPERIEMYYINFDGEEEMVDRLTAVN